MYPNIAKAKIQSSDTTFICIALRCSQSSAVRPTVICLSFLKNGAAWKQP